jgi:hypothetical protein
VTTDRSLHFCLKALRPKSSTSWCITCMLSDYAALSIFALYVSAIFACCLSEIRSCRVAAKSARSKVNLSKGLGTCSLEVKPTLEQAFS